MGYFCSSKSIIPRPHMRLVPLRPGCRRTHSGGRQKLTEVWNHAPVHIHRGRVDAIQGRVPRAHAPGDRRNHVPVHQDGRHARAAPRFRGLRQAPGSQRLQARWNLRGPRPPDAHVLLRHRRGRHHARRRRGAGRGTWRLGLHAARDSSTTRRTQATWTWPTSSSAATPRTRTRDSTSR